MHNSPLFIIERARRYLAALPPAESGHGGHNATFRAACVAYHGFDLPEDTAMALLSEWNGTHCHPQWSASELVHKVQSAAGTTSDKPRGYLLGETTDASMPASTPTPKWPPANAALIAEITAAGPAVIELAARSPHPINADEDGSDCADILQALFASEACPDPLLCIGKSKKKFSTRALSLWLANGKLPDLTLVVPSPMSRRTGRTKKGHMSEHSADNTGPRRFLVVEFDKGSFDDHAARLWHLAEYAPLTLVVHSAGRSLHGWFYCQGSTEASLHKFMRYAVSIGACRATWTTSQFVRLPGGLRFVRLPGGLRNTRCRQSVFYFNPDAINAKEETL